MMKFITIDDYDEIHDDITIDDYDEIHDDITIDDYDEIHDDITIDDYDEIHDDITIDDYDEINPVFLNKTSSVKLQEKFEKQKKLEQMFLIDASDVVIVLIARIMIK